MSFISGKLDGYFWKVKVVYYDDTYPAKKHNDTYITYGRSYAEVGAQIEERYGEEIDSIDSVRIEPLTEKGDVYEVEEDLT